MTMWRHNICLDCWWQNNPGRVPARYLNDTTQVCCFCGKENRDGVYIRFDGRQLRCNGECK